MRILSLVAICTIVFNNYTTPSFADHSRTRALHIPDSTFPELVYKSTNKTIDWIAEEFAEQNDNNEKALLVALLYTWEIEQLFDFRDVIARKYLNLILRENTEVSRTKSVELVKSYVNLDHLYFPDPKATGRDDILFNIWVLYLTDRLHVSSNELLQFGVKSLESSDPVIRGSGLVICSQCDPWLTSTISEKWVTESDLSMRLWAAKASINTSRVFKLRDTSLRRLAVLWGDDNVDVSLHVCRLLRSDDFPLDKIDSSYFRVHYHRMEEKMEPDEMALRLQSIINLLNDRGEKEIKILSRSLELKLSYLTDTLLASELQEASWLNFTNKIVESAPWNCKTPDLIESAQCSLNPKIALLGAICESAVSGETDLVKQDGMLDILDELELTDSSIVLLKSQLGMQRDTQDLFITSLNEGNTGAIKNYCSAWTQNKLTIPIHLKNALLKSLLDRRTSKCVPLLNFVRKSSLSNKDQLMDLFKNALSENIKHNDNTYSVLNELIDTEDYYSTASDAILLNIHNNPFQYQLYEILRRHPLLADIVIKSAVSSENSPSRDVLLELLIISDIGSNDVVREACLKSLSRPNFLLRLAARQRLLEPGQ